MRFLGCCNTKLYTTNISYCIYPAWGSVQSQDQFKYYDSSANVYYNNQNIVLNDKHKKIINEFSDFFKLFIKLCDTENNIDLDQYETNFIISLIQGKYDNKLSDKSSI